MILLLMRKLNYNDFIRKPNQRRLFQRKLKKRKSLKSLNSYLNQPQKEIFDLISMAILLEKKNHTNKENMKNARNN